jgi:hypothetical protein
VIAVVKLILSDLTKGCKRFETGGFSLELVAR